MIAIENVTKTFSLDNKPITAVDSLSLKINEGEIFGVIGYSGAGKSTLVRLLNRLEEPSDGKIFIDGQEMTSLKGKNLRLERQKIGMIFQHFNLLWSRTTAENIAFPLEIASVPKKERDTRVRELIELVGLVGRENAYPSQLSGGQKQRVGIARALANEPKVLLCDEATSALDPETTNSILNLLVDINEKLGLTIVLITHEMHVIRKICNRVAVMEKGRIVETGDVLDVFSEPKQSVTKKFVEQVMTNPESDERVGEILDFVEPQGKVIKLHFTGAYANEAIISEVSKKFEVLTNIIKGKITQTQSGILGTLIIQVIGDAEEIKKVEDFMEEASIELEVIRDDT